MADAFTWAEARPTWSGVGLVQNSVKDVPSRMLLWTTNSSFEEKFTIPREVFGHAKATAYSVVPLGMLRVSLLDCSVAAA
jgi:hypothetical protein